MTRIKLCGMTRPGDIEAVNELKPDYIGFVFAPASRRCVTLQQAQVLKAALSPQITSVGVFVNESLNTVAELLHIGVIDIAQLHGSESEEYIQSLKAMTGKPVIRAFRIRSEQDVRSAQECGADHILLDSGTGSGMRFNWELLHGLNRPYFLAGGLDAENVPLAVRTLRPWAVDVSSGIETDGGKDPNKMAAFVAAVRKEDQP